MIRKRRNRRLGAGGGLLGRGRNPLDHAGPEMSQPLRPGEGSNSSCSGERDKEPQPRCETASEDRSVRPGNPNRWFA